MHLPIERSEPSEYGVQSFQATSGPQVQIWIGTPVAPSLVTSMHFPDAMFTTMLSIPDARATASGFALGRGRVAFGTTVTARPRGCSRGETVGSPLEEPDAYG